MTSTQESSTSPKPISSLRRHEALRHHSLPMEILQRQVRALSINKQLRAKNFGSVYEGRRIRTDWKALLELATIPGYSVDSHPTHSDTRRENEECETRHDPVVDILQRILRQLEQDIKDDRRRLKCQRRERRKRRELERLAKLTLKLAEENKTSAVDGTSEDNDVIFDTDVRMSVTSSERRHSSLSSDRHLSDGELAKSPKKQWNRRSVGSLDSHVVERVVFPGGFPVAPSWKERRRLIRQRSFTEESRRGLESTMDNRPTTCREDLKSCIERSQSDDEYQKRLGISDRRVSRQFRRYFLVLPNGKDMSVHLQEGTFGSKMESPLSMLDLTLPDHVGWLFDQSEGRTVWGVVVDIVFCVFEDQKTNKPIEVVLLPGCAIRPLVYKTAINGVNARQNSTTISGIAKYQLVIDNSSNKRKHLFSFDTQQELDIWYRVLKTASNLDSDAAQETKKNGRRSPMIATKHNGELDDITSAKYVPSSNSQSRVQKLSQSPQSSPREESQQNGEEVKSGQTGCSQAVPSSSNLMRNDSRRQSVQDFRKRLRRESDAEITKPQPLKAQHFEPPTNTEKKVGPVKKLRSFGSLESLLKFKRKHKKKDICDTVSNEETGSTVSTSSAEQELMTSSVDFSNSKSKLKNSKTRQMSRSLDLGQPRNGLDNSLIRRASDIKDKVFHRRSSKTGTKLGDLQDISIHGYLQHKHRLRWQKMWCVVCRGCFYGFKSQSADDIAQLAAVLSNCTVNYIAEQDKRHKRMHMFKLSQENARSIYLCANSNNELSQWLQSLQMEANSVNSESDILDSVETGSDISVVSHSSRGRSTTKGESAPREQGSSDQSSGSGQKKKAPAKPPRTHRPSSCPPPTNRKNSLPGVSTDDSSTAEDWDKNSATGMDDNSAIFHSTEDLPTHDKALTHVWQNERGYLFNVIKAKMKSYKRKQQGIYNRDLPGPDNEGLLLVDDGRDGTLRKKAPREVRRSRSFNSNSKNMDDDVKKSSTPTSSPTHMRKRHKPLIVKKIPANELENYTVAGYIERKSFTGSWIKYWYVLHEGTLFCYLTSDDNVTVDVLDLHGYFVSPMIDKFRGKRFVLQLSHDNFTSLYLSTDTREEMEQWEHHLGKAVGRPSSTVREDNDDGSGEGACAGCESARQDDMKEKRQQVKQKLLEEMLRQKHELERKQAERLKKQRSKDPDSPDRSLNGPFNSEILMDEQRTSDVTRLRQRRMSTQLKMDTIQKQIQSSNHQKRSLFGFGKPKKTDENKNVFLQSQLRELTEKLNKIDTNLTQKEKQTIDAYDVNQNKHSDLRSSLEPEVFHSESMDSLTMDVDGNVQRVNSLKATMQKWHNKTFNKTSVKKKHQNGKHFQNGSVPNLTTVVQPNGDVNGHHYEAETNFEPDDYFSSDSSVTDLTKPTADLRLDLNSTPEPHDAMSISPTSSRYLRSNSRSSTISSLSSPRREIAPSVLAEIDAFEEMTRQVLSSRSKETAAK